MPTSPPPPPKSPPPGPPLVMRSLACDVPSVAADSSEENEADGPPRRISKAARLKDLELEDRELKVELKRQKIQTEKEAQETLRYARKMMKEIVDKYGNDNRATTAVNSISSIGNT